MKKKQKTNIHYFKIRYQIEQVYEQRSPYNAFPFFPLFLCGHTSIFLCEHTSIFFYVDRSTLCGHISFYADIHLIFLRARLYFLCGHTSIFLCGHISIFMRTDLFYVDTYLFLCGHTSIFHELPPFLIFVILYESGHRYFLLPHLYKTF